VGNAHQKHIGKLVGDDESGGSFVPLKVLSGMQRGPARDAGATRDSLVPVGELLSTHTNTLAIPLYRPKILTGDIFEADDVLVAPASSIAGRTRPVLKIQDGCNNRCAYCVIPFVRGRSRSLAPERVKQEVSALAAAGAREIVLSGVNLGAYGRDLVPRVELCKLLERLVDETSIERLRLSSIEPMDLTLDLVELVARSGRIAPHFHVPLQSGSDGMLAAMHRWYRAAHYAERILRAADLLAGAAIGADVICGFPGETEDDHRQTVEFIERLPFTYLHVFSYSSRPGTQAAAMAGAVAPSVIRERSRELRALSARKAAAFRAAQNGSRQRVLTLMRSGTWPDGQRWTSALTGNYLHVRVSGRWPRNTWLDVQLSEESGELRGEICP
jgi:threonylcarbamoyladenosine tRNA methylthiotransferase MtaB